MRVGSLQAGKIGNAGQNGGASRIWLLGVAAVGLSLFSSVSLTGSWGVAPAYAQEEQDEQPADAAENQDTAKRNQTSADDESEEPAIEPLSPGEAVVTRFSNVIDDVDAKKKPIKVIDINGTSASIIDIRRPGQQPNGQHWINEPQRLFVTAGDVGQVFGVALAPRKGKGPDIFLSATSAFGLHLDAKGNWMDGMWGPDAGPGTIYRISEENGYRPEKFTDVQLDGRDNTGAALGNIAYDKFHNRLFVSDLETGMIHSVDAKTGKDFGYYDHGTLGRTDFLDVWSKKRLALDPVAFDPETASQMEDCASDFAQTPECWNLADFRRRVWGLRIRADQNGVRLFYSVWGSDAVGNPEWAKAGDDRRNSVWSVKVGDDGLFDLTSVRREFFMPAFWPDNPDMGDIAGNSNAVTDITFPECGPQNVMLVAERGAPRNLGLKEDEAFARPYESRVLRYELGKDGVWRPAGRYDVGFHDRDGKEGEPLLFANAAGGVDFGYRLGKNGAIDFSAPGQSVWATGDGLCSPNGACTDKTESESGDTSEVHGLQGTPADLFVPVEPEGTNSKDALQQSIMIDTDINIDSTGAPIPEELERNDATRIGDVAIYQVCEAVKPLPVIPVPEEIYEEEVEPPPLTIPVHTLNRSHAKWASSGHRVQSSWHWRKGSWHQADRSWHWREGSWHDRDRSWHRRNGSWHDVDRSWHMKVRSYHSRNRSWGDRPEHSKRESFHYKGRSWGDRPDHRKGKSFHVTNRSWNDDRPDHRKGESFHFRGRSWNDDRPDHKKDQSFHVKGRSWNDDRPDHRKDKSFHVKGRSWSDDRPDHKKDQSFHMKGRSWNDDRPDHKKDKSFHVKGRSWNDDRPDHRKDKSYHVKGRSWSNDDRPDHMKSQSLLPIGEHSKRKSSTDTNGDQDKPDHKKDRSYHTKGKSFFTDGRPAHAKSRSAAEKDNNDVDVKPQHSKRKSNANSNDDNEKPQHSKRQSRVVENNDNDVDVTPQHSKRKSNANSNDDNTPLHSKRKSNASNNDNNTPQHSKRQSRIVENNNNDVDVKPQHSKRKSNANSNNDNTPQHSKRQSRVLENRNDGVDQKPQHSKRKSNAGADDAVPRHTKRKSNATDQ